jgi:hypothetical protein
MLGHCAAGAAGLFLAGRVLEMPLLRIVVTSLRPRLHSTRIIHLAGPMTVINATSAVAYGTDRLVLGHAADATAVAVYSAGAQLYAPASALITASAVPLWGHFVRRRCNSDGVPRAELRTLTAWFAGGARRYEHDAEQEGPAATEWMTHDRAGAGRGLMAAFAALILVHAVVYPVAMWQTDPASLRFLAARTMIMALVSLALSVPLARAIGPAGPVTASVAAYTLWVAIPCFRRAFRHV